MKKGTWVAVIVATVVLLFLLLTVLAVGVGAFLWAAKPQLRATSYDTRDSSAMTDLKLLRSQVQLYKAQHNETYPTTWGPNGQLDVYTDVKGNTSASYDKTFRFGPYLLRVPTNPYTGVNTVTIVTDEAAAYEPAADMSQGWWYNSATGEVRCHVPDSVVTSEGTPVNTL